MAKLLALVSGGIDSAAAAALALEQGHGLAAVHFERAPFSDRAIEEKAKQILKHLARQHGKKIKLVIVPHGEFLTQVARNCSMKHVCVLCRRMMLRIAAEVAKSEGCEALLTGESLGQVASQTLHNIAAEHSAASMPVVRPLLGMDKIEIEKIAKGFKTYTISILPGGCCEIVPPKPATQATPERALAEERKIDIATLVSGALAQKRVYEIG